MSTTQPPASPARCRATMTGPTVTGPSMARPSVTGPSLTGPSVTRASVTGPSVTRPSVTGPSVTEVRCEALFASGLQASDTAGPEAVAEAIMRTLRRLGRQGCAGLMAQEFGDHPEVAGERMRWARRVVTGTPAPLPC